MSIHGEQHEEYMSAQEVAAELLKTATRLTRLANELLQGRSPRAAAVLAAVPEAPAAEEAPSDRSVGRHGAVTEEVALMRAAELQEFGALQFAEACGLEPVAAMRWLSVLMARKPAVLAREGLRYRCLTKSTLTANVLEWVGRQRKAFSATALMRECGLERWEADEALRALMARGTLRAFEQNGYDMFESPLVDRPKIGATPEVKRGEAVRGTGDLPTRRQRSLNRHQLKQRNQRHERMVEAREERAKIQAAKAAAQPPAERKRKK